MGTAKWIQELSDVPWVLCVDGRIVKPALAALRPDASTSHLPLADFPKEVVSALDKVDLVKALEFGTAPPPSPIAELETVASQDGVGFATLVRVARVVGKCMC